MAVRGLIFALLLLATPALAQDGSSAPRASSDLPSVAAPPAGPDDAQLELAVRAAYTAAAAFASAHGNYFARDGVFSPLHDAIAAELARQGLAPFAVPAAAFADLPAAKACLAAPGGELRIVTNTYGDGIGLVAVTQARDFAYSYDPHKASAIIVTRAEDCPRAP